MNREKRLFLLDAYALIFRAYYAFINNPMTSSKGVPTSTVFGFTLSLDELLRKENPTHIAVVFDPPGPTFRHTMYPQYKANRDATPEDIKRAVPYIKRLVEGFRIPILEKPGYEADDVIGTLAKTAEGKGFDVYMVTPDKDFAQLVSENIFIYKPGRGGGPSEILGVEQVKEKFLVEHPHQVIDILALWGDTSDNIPGAPGIGEKTAKKLISQFHSVEGIYENIHQISGKQRQNLEGAREQVKLSKKLATIALEVQVELSPEGMQRREMDRIMLKDLFNELEFKNIATKILSVPVESGPSLKTPGILGTLFEASVTDPSHGPESLLNSIATVEHTYELITDREGIGKLTTQLSLLKEFCFDTETTSLDPLEAELVGIAFSWEPRKAYYVAFGSDQEEVRNWVQALSAPLMDPDIAKIGQNLKYDLHILKNYELDVKGELFDTMVAHFLLRPDQKHNLNLMAEQYLDYSMVRIEELIGSKGTPQVSFRSVPLEQAKEYACEDADITYQLSQIFRKKLDEEGFTALSSEIEMPLVRVLMEMEHHGVKLDSGALHVFAGELRELIIATEAEIYRMAGTGFNISSPKQLGEILFEKLKILPDPKKTKTKQYATGEEVLTGLADKHPVVEKVLEYRSLSKLLSTYVESLPLLVKSRTGKLHTSFNQAQVTTGRLSSNNPNLQNIPIREERGREIRKAFIPENPQHLFLSADYSQIELRIMAHLSGDPGMIAAFVNNEDIHTATAAKIYRIDPDNVTREMRGKAKTANFGIIYGISAFGLSQRMRIPRTEAKELIEGYFETYPGVRAFMDLCIRMAREKGYVETMYGRRRMLPDILSRNSVVRGNAERNAINSPIQGSAADIIKIAMVRIRDTMDREKLKSRMILQVHDELNFDIEQEEVDRIKKIVRYEMENAAPLKVPLIVDLGVGKNWLEAH
jgi:DNA polymerase-1